MKFTTIQKISELSGLAESTIRKMIKRKELTPHKFKGYSRIFIDTMELEKQIKPIEKSADIDRFLV